MKRQLGFGIVPVVAVVAVIAVVGLVGFKLWQRTTASTTVSQSDTQPVNAAPTIKNKQDLDKALRSLDSTDIAGSALQDLNKESSF